MLSTYSLSLIKGILIHAVQTLNTFLTGINNEHFRWCTATANHPPEVDSSLIIKLTQEHLTFSCLNERRRILPLMYELTVYCFSLLGVENLYKKMANNLLSGRWVVTSEYCIVSKKCRIVSPCWIKLTFTLKPQWVGGGTEGEMLSLQAGKHGTRP